jgi:AraC family transcriptional regulator of adaptative response/methylated-DNA-[protein]-cysteine methyltransferase
VSIRCGFGKTPFGRALIAFTSRGICHLSFVEPPYPGSAAAVLQARWPDATLEPDPAGSSALLERIFARSPTSTDAGLSLWVSGTNFQIQVWRALLQIPHAGLLSYRQLAELLGRPRAARTVGSAIAANRVAYLIPCHRVLRASGDFGVYHWGGERKMAMCAWEAAATNGRADPGSV